MHHFDFLVDKHFGQLHGRVRDGVFDDPVGEPVASPIDGVGLETLADVGPQRVQRGEIAEAGEEVVEVGGSSRGAP